MTVSTRTDHVRVAILGAGFAGLGMAIRLKQEGVEDFVVLEKDSDVGGTWWANTYPGCQCDIPSHLYSFSFAPNPDWTRTYPLQPELRDYLRRTAEDFGVYDHVRLNTGFLAAAEKNLLVWIAGRLPSWVNSDHLTLVPSLRWPARARRSGSLATGRLRSPWSSFVWRSTGSATVSTARSRG